MTSGLLHPPFLYTSQIMPEKYGILGWLLGRQIMSAVFRNEYVQNQAPYQSKCSPTASTPLRTQLCCLSEQINSERLQKENLEQLPAGINGLMLSFETYKRSLTGTRESLNEMKLFFSAFAKMVCGGLSSQIVDDDLRSSIQVYKSSYLFRANFTSVFVTYPMSDSIETHNLEDLSPVEIDTVMITKFDRSDPELWFAQLKHYFTRHNIGSEGTRYRDLTSWSDYVIPGIPSSYYNSNIPDYHIAVAMEPVMERLDMHSDFDAFEDYFESSECFKCGDIGHIQSVCNTTTAHLAATNIKCCNSDFIKSSVLNDHLSLSTISKNSVESYSSSELSETHNFCETTVSNQSTYQISHVIIPNMDFPSDSHISDEICYKSVENMLSEHNYDQKPDVVLMDADFSSDPSLCNDILNKFE
ncbi:unnamed protein product, partial [Schistosoma curassoni]|uniref:CCHC-type domain-containing protein n=1 Tax=Schistosoma curassoni TaxID=6186 RepID=A0A183KT25_9TREM